LQCLKRGGAGRDRRGVHVPIADQLCNALLLRDVVLHHQETLHRPVHEFVERGERIREGLLGGRLGQEVNGAKAKAPLPVFLHRDDVNWHVTGGRVVLEPVENGPSIGIG
jgi:hypothetical protein